MTRAWLFALTSALALGAYELSRGAPPVLGAALMVAAGVALVVIAHGGRALAGEAVALGAAGALAHELARPLSPVLAAAALLFFVFGTRSLRAQGWMELSARLALPLAAGAAAGWLAETYATESTAVFAVATAVAALVSALPFVLAVEAPRTFALRRLAARARGPLRARLLRAVALHRRVEQLDLPSRAHRRVERGFEELALRVERRLDRSASLVDPALKQAVDQLERWVRAVRSRDALLDGLELSASPVSTDSDAVEAEVAALTELEGGAPRPHG